MKKVYFLACDDIEALTLDNGKRISLGCDMLPEFASHGIANSNLDVMRQRAQKVLETWTDLAGSLKIMQIAEFMFSGNPAECVETL
jgi:hypothetical protein